MKPAVHLSLTSALAGVLATSTALAVNPPGHAPESASPTTVDAVSVAISHEFPHLELAQAHQQIGHLMAQVQHTAAGASHKFAPAAKGYAAAGHIDSNRPNQALLIRTRDMDLEEQSQLEEDLNVMSRILEKAAQSDATPARGPRAMGIELVLGVGSGPVRTLYLDGYGALFMVNVGFALLPAATADDTDPDEPKSETETIWEQTRQEMYGNPRSPDSVVTFVGGPELIEGQPYDAEKVEALRTSLIEALKNATNFRQLADGESVTVCVTGAPIADPRVQVFRNKSAVITKDSQPYATKSRDEQLIEQLVVRHRQFADPSTATTRAVMTIQAAKGDIDRFARGELSLDQFRERVRTHTYATAAAGDWNPHTFLWSNQ
jgi:hypothetical protein